MKDHEAIQMEIPDYVRGRLDGEDRRSVKAHLAECGDCVELSHGLHLIASAISREGDSLFEEHPGLQELEDFARARGGGASERLSRHVSTCASCELQVAVWRREQGRAVTSTARPTLSSLALIAAGILVGSALVLTFSGSPTAPTAPGFPAPEPSAPRLTAPESTSSTVEGAATAALPAHSVPMISLRSLRGGARQEIDIPPGEPAFYLVVPLALPPDLEGDTPVTFEVRRHDGAPVWASSHNPASSIRSQLESTGVIGHLVPAEVLQAGEYELHVLAGDEPEQAEISRIEFTVRRTPPLQAH